MQGLARASNARKLSTPTLASQTLIADWWVVGLQVTTTGSLWAEEFNFILSGVRRLIHQLNQVLGPYIYCILHEFASYSPRHEFELDTPSGGGEVFSLGQRHGFDVRLRVGGGTLTRAYLDAQKRNL